MGYDGSRPLPCVPFQGYFLLTDDMFTFRSANGLAAVFCFGSCAASASASACAQNGQGRNRFDHAQLTERFVHLGFGRDRRIHARSGCDGSASPNAHSFPPQRVDKITWWRHRRLCTMSTLLSTLNARGSRAHDHNHVRCQAAGHSANRERVVLPYIVPCSGQCKFSIFQKDRDSRSKDSGL